MKRLPEAERPFSQMLLGWAKRHLARVLASFSPVYKADRIAADVAASGNPSGT
ncbi:hypothetical protein [Bradyrhizobium lablabi]|uniref:hypothetical protein n=1 Tax=Bradyrhizobium lablabi TaxID=722472 RepID=UPI001BAC0976|nr:hypothetical protein [Bradyrhizobium lablabi]MBR0697148.1 hypothetical protein [Bradyrhizobium lablabi]